MLGNESITGFLPNYVEETDFRPISYWQSILNHGDEVYRVKSPREVAVKITGKWRKYYQIKINILVYTIHTILISGICVASHRRTGQPVYYSDLGTTSVAEAPAGQYVHAQHGRRGCAQLGHRPHLVRVQAIESLSLLPFRTSIVSSITNIYK